jgi:hypothetical protein
VQPENKVTPTSTGEFVVLANPSEKISGTVNRAVSQVWASLSMVYQKLGLGGGVIDAERREYGNDRVVGTRVNDQPIDAYFRCGNQGTAVGATARMRVQFRITTTVAELAPERSEVTTRIIATATPVEGTSSGRIACASNGALEQEILRAL